MTADMIPSLLIGVFVGALFGVIPAVLMWRALTRRGR